MQIFEPRPLTFSGYHGCNVVIEDNGTCCYGQYVRAHGQFITTTPLRQGVSFFLELRGTGVVKFNTFASKHQAVDWVRSNQPLPRGCKRIRMKGTVQYSISVPNPGRCVLLESIPYDSRSRFTFETGPATTLAFDIEYGDVAVSMLNTESSLTFDSFCHSPHVEISKTNERSSAVLTHYNPSSLCCLESTCLVPGSVFNLKVEHSGSSSGSYIRVCVAKQLQLRVYENNDWDRCWGKTIQPCYKGKRRIITEDSVETLTVQVFHQEITVSRSGRDLEKISFLENVGNTLWLELHRVSVRAWQIYECGSSQPENICPVFDEADEEPPSSLTLLPPPPPPPMTQAACRQRKTKRAAHARHCNQAGLGGICNKGYMSETSSSDTRGKRPSPCGRSKSFKSVQSISQPRYINSMTSPHASCCHPPSKMNRKQRDLLCDTDVDMTPFVSCGQNLISLTSSETLNESHKIHQSVQESHYEQPDRIWSRQKKKLITSNHNEQGPTSCPARDLHGKHLPPRKMPQKSCLIQQSNTCSCQTQTLNVNFNTNISGGTTSATVVPNSESHQRAVGHKLSEGNDRLAFCEQWIQNVNKSRRCWSSLERNIEDEVVSGECCREHAVRCLGDLTGQERIHYDRNRNHQPDCYETPTSSVWISATGNFESVQHDLDIQIVPVQGQFRNHSSRSQSFTSNFREPCSHLSNTGVGNDFHETTLKKLCYELHSPENSAAYSSDSETCPKSIDSGGFDVNKRADHDASCRASDGLGSNTCLKTVDEGDREGRRYVHASSSLQTTNICNVSEEKMLPKPHRYQQWCDLFLPGFQNHVLLSKANDQLKTATCDANGNHFELHNETEESSHDDDDDDDDEDNHEDLAEISQDAITSASNTGSEKENELSEPVIDTDSGVFMRVHTENPRRNIIASSISNSSHSPMASLWTAWVNPGPTIKLPTHVDCNHDTESTIKRTDTLKRNLDTSPRPSFRKTCGSKMKSLTFDPKTEASESTYLSDICKKISELEVCK